MDACNSGIGRVNSRSWGDALLDLACRVRDHGPRIVVGAVLLTAGLLKAFAPIYFAQQLALYDIGLSKPALAAVAYVLIVVECIVGAMLLLQVRLRVALAIATFLVIGFMAATGWAWWGHLTATCGCFGPVKLTPKKAFAVDVVLFAMLARTWWGPLVREHAARWRRAAIILVALVAVGLPLTRAQAGVSFMTSLNPHGRAGLDQAFVWDLPVDLGRGSHLVYVLNASCGDCKRLAPAMEALGRDGRMPAVVGLAAQDAGERQAFSAQTGVRFPIGQVSDNAVFTLLERNQYPSILFLRDGQIVKAWSMRVPSVDEVLAAAAAPSD